MSELDRFAASHYCVSCKHGSSLVVRWNTRLSREEVACGVCGNTEHFERMGTLTDHWKRNPATVSISVANRLTERYGGEPMSSQQLAVIDKKQMLSRMEEARFFKDLTPQERSMLAAVSVRYGYDPVMREMTVYEHRIYVTTEGHRNKAGRHTEFAGLQVRPMTPQERESYNWPKDKVPYAYIAFCYKKGFAVPSIGTGRADPIKPYRNNQIEVHHPEWMAESRAARRAIAPYFPPDNPFAASDVPLAANPETGEVIEGEYTVESNGPESEPEAPTAEPPERAPRPKAEPKPTDPLSDFFKQAMAIGFPSSKAVLKALGVTDMDDWLAGGKSFDDALADLRALKGA